MATTQFGPGQGSGIGGILHESALVSSPEHRALNDGVWCWMAEDTDFFLQSLKLEMFFKSYVIFFPVQKSTEKKEMKIIHSSQSFHPRVITVDILRSLFILPVHR